MKRPLHQIQYSRLLALYYKLNARLKKHFAFGRFQKFSSQQQYKLISRIERIKTQLGHLERGAKLAGVAIAVGFALHSTEATAQFSTIGSEFQVNTTTKLDQENSSIAMDSDGDFVIVWENYGMEVNNWRDIYAQRYNASGVPQGEEFIVTTGYQYKPSIAMDSDGDFVITWVSDVRYGDDYSIYARRYDASGVAQGGEFQANTYPTNYQGNPSIVMDSDGDFVITWQSKGQDGDNAGIYAQRYDASGIAQGGEFQVNAYTIGNQQFPSIAMDIDGDFVITWSSLGQDGDNYGIYAQRYDASGAAQGGEFLVNTYTTGNQELSSIAMDNDGDFVITWTGYAQDGDATGIYAQRYNSSGVKQGGEFRVNTYTTDEQKKPAISMDSDGDFVISWEGNPHGYSYDIYAQRYDASGDPQGGEFQVNTYTDITQKNPSIAIDSDENFAIIWQSFGQDGSGYAIEAQRYKGVIGAGIVNAFVDSHINIYPNPSVGAFTIHSSGLALDAYTVRIINAMGEIVYTGSFTEQLNVQQLPKGVYTLMLENEKGSIVKQIVLQ